VVSLWSTLVLMVSFMQSGVQGAWGIVPIYLGEISPPAFRASFAGVAYQVSQQ
jgi:hypothetical protein